MGRLWLWSFILVTAGRGGRGAKGAVGGALLEHFHGAFEGDFGVFGADALGALDEVVELGFAMVGNLGPMIAFFLGDDGFAGGTEFEVFAVGLFLVAGVHSEDAGE